VSPKRRLSQEGQARPNNVSGSKSQVFSKADTPEKKQAWVHEIFESISTDYDRMNDVESFGLHRRWKRVLVRSVAESLKLEKAGAAGEVRVAEKTPTNAATPDCGPGCNKEASTALDVACGTGDITIALAIVLPAAVEVCGLDFSERMLEVASSRVAALPPEVRRPYLMHGDALHLPFADNSLQALSISFGLRNLPDYAAALREFNRVLAPGAKFFCLDASYPTTAVVKPLFRLYFKHLMPRLASFVVGHRQEYKWLNDSTEAFLSKSALAALMAACGFQDVGFRSFFCGVAALHIGVKPLRPGV